MWNIKGLVIEIYSEEIPNAIKHQSHAAKDRVNDSKNNNEQGLVHYSRHLTGIFLNLHNSMKQSLISSPFHRRENKASERFNNLPNFS